MGMDAKWIMFPVIMIEEIFVVLVQRAFTEKILNTKGRRTFNEIAAWCIYFLIFNLTTYVLTDSAVVYLLIFCGSFFSLLLYLYKDSLRHLIFTTVFLYLIGVFSELLTYYMVIVPFGRNQERLERTDYYFMIAVISKLIWFCLIKIILLFVKRNREQEIGFRDWLEACFVPVGSVLIIYSFLPTEELYRNSNASLRVINWAGMCILLGINIVTYYLYEKVKISAEKEMYEKALREQCNYYMRQCEESKALWTELSKFRHDMKQKFIFFQTLLKCEKYKELEGYYEENLRFLAMENRVAFSGNIFFDSIWNYKAEIADKDGIEFITELKIPHDCRINGQELSICLGNLLDNAIEAARETERDKRQISIKIRVQGENLFMEIQNYYSTPRIRQGKDYLTTKKDVHSHGWGLRIIHEMVEAYHGELEIKEEQGIFCVRVLLYQVIS